MNENSLTTTYVYTWMLRYYKLLLVGRRLNR